jgi:hypothetical protein
VQTERCTGTNRGIFATYRSESTKAVAEQLSSKTVCSSAFLLTSLTWAYRKTVLIPVTWIVKHTFCNHPFRRRKAVVFISDFLNSTASVFQGTGDNPMTEVDELKKNFRAVQEENYKLQAVITDVSMQQKCPRIIFEI